MVSSNHVGVPTEAQMSESAYADNRKAKGLPQDDMNDEHSLKRLIVNGLSHFHKSSKRLRSERDDDGEAQGAEKWAGGIDWEYEVPDCHEVASMLQLASMMDTAPSPTQEPRHRYKRRNSIVDGMLTASTRQYLTEAARASPEPTRYQRSSLPWNFKTTAVPEKAFSNANA